MNKHVIRGLVVVATGLSLAAGSTSCTKDLDQTPKYELTPDKVYVDLNGYRQVLAKLYGGFALTGQQGPAGAGDIGGIDEGTSDYLRQYWSAQELSTDEATIVWNDLGIRDWHNMNWDSSNPLIRGLYSRIFFEIAACNEFIRESSDDKISSRLPGADATSVKRFRAEARFLRAVAYMHAMDLFGNGPFVTENDAVGFAKPQYYTRQQYFEYVEKELTALAADPDFAEPRANEYARVDKAAAWAMLARLYLNAQVYTGTARYTDAAAQAKKVIDAGYTLATTPAGNVASAYGRLFLADNNTAPARNEIIWPIAFDVNSTQSYGGSTFLVNGATGSNSSWQARVGQSTGWGGIRTTSSFFNLFQSPGGGVVSDTARDTRGRFWTKKTDNSARPLEIKDLYNFEEGFGVIKFRNVNSAGVAQGGSQNFSGVDFPMIRLAEVMLTYAEAVYRGGAGDRTLALSYINQIRARAFNNQAGSAVTDAQVAANNLQFILDERGRELYWEAYRRTDLIRFNKFVEGSYLWPFKGGVPNGRAVEAFRTLYPIPASDLSVNQNLKQNTGY
ncbi:RagB/SusD family nutrient uptake outer membrane protein [Hymenobacter taeanensis]|uniref:RagB/SusD family nutrient uptake outer membrane protein n=1 Tax=Hymenobacter taeanensis TaxID=2735321 RepID=A0A6M6BJH9_9BACT|nr:MULTISPECIES: RagB/SusD family nutrient uptake outer membrane protein [Hymenobacter]QJX48139.1 RagB/SusD family nutrient uptake outer membrane protein [Hymenobacter taeanensis]UOQ82391.1 RagB/SusD family nutrient uptake outer membrane protein [Hymenobacter sp. 5414T-23]